MPDVVPPLRIAQAQRARELIATYREVEDLLSIGADRRGSAPRLDDAIDRMPRLEAFLRQGPNEPTSNEQTHARLTALFEEVR
jgi:flagellum-specific ATP synthase